MAAKRGVKDKKEARNTMTTATPRSLNATAVIVLLVAVAFIIPSSEAFMFFKLSNPEKKVIVQNNYTNILSVRCFSFDTELKVRHLKPNETFEFKFHQSRIFPTSTMFNCSTNAGTFMAFRDDFECNNFNLCQWKFDDRAAYTFILMKQSWVSFEFEPNYQSQERGGVVKGVFNN